MYYPNSRYDYYLDCTDENERKRNILYMSDRFLNFHNPNRWNGIGTIPQNVEANTYQRTKVQFGKDKKDWCYLDMWLDTNNNTNAVIVSRGDLQEYTTDIGSVQSIAETVAKALGYDYNYNDVKLNIWGFIP